MFKVEYQFSVLLVADMIDTIRNTIWSVIEWSIENEIKSTTPLAHCRPLISYEPWKSKPHASKIPTREFDHSQILCFNEAC